LAAFLAGCAGYKLGPTNGLPAGSRSVEVRSFVNKTKRTAHHRVPGQFHAQTIQQDGSFRLETSGRGDILVTGEIIRFNRSGLSYQTNDVLTPQEYTLALVAHVVAINVNTGKTNLNKEVSGEPTSASATIKAAPSAKPSRCWPTIWPATPSPCWWTAIGRRNRAKPLPRSLSP
jgi:hypothetical protein